MLQIVRKLWHNNATNPSECLEKMTTCIQQRAAEIHAKHKVKKQCSTEGKPAFVFSEWCILLGHCSSVLESSYFSF